MTVHTRMFQMGTLVVGLTEARKGKRRPSSAMEYTILLTVVRVQSPHENTVNIRPAVTMYWGIVKPVQGLYKVTSTQPK